MVTCHRQGHSLGKNKVAQNEKQNKITWINYSKIMGNPEVVLLSDIIKLKPFISEEWVAEPSSHLKSQPHHHLGTFFTPNSDTSS